MTTADDGEAVRDERRAVVDQALSLDDRDEPSWHPEAPRDGCRGDGIGRRDDGAEHEGRAPGEIVDRRVGDHRHDEGRHDHEPDREQADRAQVQLQLVQRREERSGVQQRRQHRDENEIRRELQLGHPGHEPERQPADHEHDRVWDPERGRDDKHGADGHQQHEKHEQLLVRQLHDDTLRLRARGDLTWGVACGYGSRERGEL